VQLGDFIQIAKGQYGLDKSATEDALFTNSVMTDMVNNAHKEFAAVARCYYATFASVTVTAVTTGTGILALDPTVIEFDIYTFDLKSGAGAWTQLTLRHLRSLRKDLGPLQAIAAGTPAFFFIHPGASASNAKVVEMQPGPSNAFLGGASAAAGQYNAWVYPPDLTNLTDTPVLEVHEHWRLIPWICWQMALLENSRGRSSPEVVQLWYDRALTAALELREIFRWGMEEIPRTASVGLSSGDDAQARRIRPFRGQGQAPAP